MWLSLGSGITGDYFFSLYLPAFDLCVYRSMWDSICSKTAVISKGYRGYQGDSKTNPQRIYSLEPAEDQLDPTQRLISPCGDPCPYYTLIATHSHAEQHTPRHDRKWKAHIRTQNGRWASSKKSPPFSLQSSQHSSPLLNAPLVKWAWIKANPTNRGLLCLWSSPFSVPLLH